MKMRVVYAALAIAAPTAVFAQAVSIQVNAGAIVRPVDDRQFSINTAIWDSNLSNPQTVTLLQSMDIRSLRYPGGSISDGYHWQTNTNDPSTPSPTYIANSFDQFETTAQAMHAQVMITANYGSGTPQEAAAWVQYANVTKSYNVKYWEIGNEEYASWEFDTHSPKHDPVTYATLVQQYIAQMKAVDPTIRIGVIVTEGEDSFPTSHAATNPRTGVAHVGWTPVMLATLKSLGVVPDFAIYHRYEFATGQEDDTALLQKAQTWPADAANLRQQLNDYLGSSGAGVEVIVTENNSNGETSGKQTTSLINGLYLADSYANLVQTEINGLYWWDLRNQQTPTGGNMSPSLYGWRNYGDQGVLSGFSTFYPTYYALKILSHFARGGDAIVQASSNSTLLSAYAAKRGDGSLSLLVINKSPTASTAGNFSLTGFSPAATATQYSYGIAQDNAAQAGATDGSIDVQTASVAIGGATFSQTFPPYSVTLLAIPAAASAGSSARLLNISSRGYVQGSTHQLTAGFVISGNSGDTETVVIRGVGPTLGNFGVASAVADPALHVTGSNQVDVSNDNWSSGSAAATSSLSSAFGQVGAFALANGSLDSAMLLTLSPGNYTAQVSGNGGSAGDALVEVYEVASTGSARLVNISSRGYVDSSGHAMTDGFVVGGSGAEKVVIRGIGATLSSFGVNPALADPSLRVFRADGTVFSASDDWDGTPALASAFSSVLAFALPVMSRDAAVLLTLPSASYTAQVSGTGGNAGDALVEVYEVSPGP